MKGKEERKIVVLSEGVEKNSALAGACCFVFYVPYRSVAKE